ncbi:MAG: S8 family peptidase [Hyphomicrobiaceae bacterium]
MRFMSRLLFALCVLPSSGGTIFAQPPSTQPPDPARIGGYTEVLQRAAQVGRKVRIIARLSEAAVSGGRPDAPAAMMPRTDTAFRTARDNIVRRFLGPELAIASVIAGLPLIVLDVDRNELERLIAAGEIAEVFEDVPVPPTLAQSGPLLRAPQAWALGARGAGLTVAVLDTGVQSNHPFLTGRIVEEACFSSTSASQNATSLCPGGVSESTTAGAGQACGVPGCEHGTHVAGIAAGRAAGPTTFSGIAPDADILAIQVFSRFDDSGDNAPCRNANRPSPCILSFTSDQLRALQHVLDRSTARTIVSANMSLGGGRHRIACDTDPRKAVVDALLAAGVATVISSGNSGLSDSVGAPGCISTAITIGSTTKTDTVSLFSNSSSLVDLLAPGSDIVSSVTGGGFRSLSGTSMAAPQVAGVFASLRSRNRTVTVAQALAALQTSGMAIADPRNSLIHRRINVEGAVLAIPAR